MNATDDGGEIRIDAERIEAVVVRYRDDAGFREQLAAGDTAGALDELGLDIPADIEARVVANTDEVFHFVLPGDPNRPLTDESLAIVAGGAGTAGSAGSVSSAGTASTGISCFGTISSVGSAGTAGSAS